MNFREWHIPFRREAVRLRDAYESLGRTGAEQDEVPLMVQLVENPKFSFPGFDIFHGRVDLTRHDCIHIALGRGLLEKDEAFTIGFTMGSTKKVTTAEETLFAWVSQNFYPKIYQFDDDDIAVFRNAVRLAYISGCVPLDQFDFKPHFGRSLRELRAILGLESDLLLAYYRIERDRYPEDPASRRLLDL